MHHLRADIRRFACFLEVLRPCFPRKEARAILRQLREIMQQAGRVRDRDIALRLLTKLGVPASGLRFRTERNASAKELGVLLARWLEDGYPVLRAESRDRPVRKTAVRILPPMSKEFFRRGKHAARDEARAKELHRFRIAAKKFRYTLDSFEWVYGGSVDGLILQLRRIQKQLGEINDYASVRRMVSGRKIRAALKRAQRKKVEQFRRRWAAQFSGADVVREWMETLRQSKRA